MHKIDLFGILARQVEAKGRSVDLADEAVRAKFHSRLKAFSEPLSFANVLLFTLALHLAFFWRRPLLVAQGVFSMHFVSFALLSSFAFWPTGRLLRINVALGLMALVAIVIWQFAYLTVGLRRFYLPGRKALTAWPLAITAAIVLYVLNSAFITGVQIVGGSLALWTL